MCRVSAVACRTPNVPRLCGVVETEMYPSTVGICTYVENAIRPMQHHTLDGYMNTLQRRRIHITECTQKRSTPPPILAYENVASHSLCKAMHMALVQFL